MVLGMIIGVVILALGFVCGYDYAKQKLKEEDNIPLTDNGLYSTKLLMRDATIGGYNDK